MTNVNVKTNDNKTVDDKLADNDNMTDKDRTPEAYTVQERLRDQSNGEISNVRDDDMITYSQTVPDGQGGLKEIKHGPMKVSEWTEYSKNKGL